MIDVMNDLILNVILMLFPILVYFIYNCYLELKCEKYNDILLSVVLIISLHLSLKYGGGSYNSLVILFSNFPIMIAFLKRKFELSLILMVMVLMYSYFSFDVNLYLLILKFFLYYLVLFWGIKRRVKDFKLILAIIVVQVFFIGMEFSVYSFSGLCQLISFGFILFLFSFLPFGLIFIFKLGDNITSLYSITLEMEHDKELKNSLFKITHEVKNPIAVCKGYLDMMDVLNSEQVERYIPIVRAEMNRALAIMNDFMEFSKVTVHKEIIDINMLLEEVEEEFSLFFRGRDVLFDCDIMDCEIYVDGDYDKLKQVFVNLIKNSFESIEGAGKIEVCCWIDCEYYVISIIDNGSGMDEDILRQIKEVFFTTKSCGSGVGVSLSNEIILAHQGSLNYDSEVGKGTKCVVKLPITVL